MKIIINTGLTISPNDCTFDDLHPKHQIERIRQLVGQNTDFILNTNSDQIIREINIMIMEGIIDYKNVFVFEDGTKRKTDRFGSSIVSIDDVIDEQHERSSNIYYRLKYENT